MPSWARWVGLVVALHASHTAWNAGLRPGPVAVAVALGACAAWAVGLPVHEAAGSRAAEKGRGLRAGDYLLAAVRGAVTVALSAARWLATAALLVVGLSATTGVLVWLYGHLPPSVYVAIVVGTGITLLALVGLSPLRSRFRARRRRRTLKRFSPHADGFASAWARSVCSTGPVDRTAAESIVADLYREARLPVPEIVWASSPAAFVGLFTATQDDTNPALARRALGTSQPPGRHELLSSERLGTWLSVLDAVAASRRVWPEFLEPLPLGEAVGAFAAGATAATLTNLATLVPRFHFRTRTVVLLERPLELHLDDAGELHNLEGPAIRFSDQTARWAIHGISVGRDVIEAPETIDPLQALSHPNAEVRRILIERIGYERIVAAAERRLLAPIAEDDTGKLWHLSSHEPEPLALVEVENATLEPDGSRKRYFLRVPPACRTAREAVAWTFALDASDYQPGAQS